ncbi:MAG: imidazoleglycerol-phosphate dehydratase HisB [Rhodospirillales bacterium]|nr:imidazoleglycerol-phosphate dehydratase HisB [Rhodospirillales bacterium]
MRQASIERATKETKISASVGLDGTGVCDVTTGIGFLDHMLEQLSRHGLIDLTLKAEGDLHVDSHHTVEDTGIVIGEAVNKALGDRVGITRFGVAYVPLDEALSRVVVDLSDRPYLVWNVNFSQARLGEMDTELFRDWFQAFAQGARLTLHVDNLAGRNSHHVAETIFKALARALRQAVALDEGAPGGVPSTKGVLSSS